MINGEDMLASDQPSPSDENNSVKLSPVEQVIPDFIEQMTDSVSSAHIDNDQIIILQFKDFSRKTIDEWLARGEELRTSWKPGVPGFFCVDVRGVTLSEVRYLASRIIQSSDTRPDINAFIVILLGRSLASQILSAFTQTARVLNPNTRLQIVSNREDALRWLRHHVNRLNKAKSAINNKQ